MKKSEATHIKFSLVKEALFTHALSEEILLVDNFDPKNKFYMVGVTDYPIKFDRYILGFCLQGSSYIEMGQSKILIQTNDFIAISPERVFRVSEKTKDFKIAFILLKSNFFPYQKEFMQANNLYGTIFSQPSHPLPKALMKEMMDVYDLIQRKIDESDHTYRMDIIRHYLYIIFYNICHCLLAEKKENASINHRKQKIFSQFIEDVENNFRKERTVLYYANKLCLSTKYFSRVIQEVSGRPASEWIQELVIMEAQILLKTSDMSILQISENLNFPTQSDFSRYFKQITGVSPKTFRNS